MRSLGIPGSEIEDYIQDLKEIHEHFEDLEFDDLLDEYNIKMGEFTTASWGDDPYSDRKVESTYLILEVYLF